MTNPYQPQPSSYLTTPVPSGRPRMFNSTIAKVIWILLPIVTIGIGAAVPFVVAAVKGVVKPWLAGVYVLAEVVILGISTAAAPGGESPFVGMLIIFLIVASATHTALLDNDRVSIGK
ncbi:MULTISPECIES: hypothetical protein [Streptomyces]|uniref:hypothetical protein n=1 Tax=Streptomyces TaxID=1883 RepID=UPI00081B4408|nr:hypothetical protein [Streptomyces sp. OspMP-M43]MYR13835.1 hypothetical protein [Streptomyces sp. SID724]NEB53402.1 hypothetical protein [Streptomyces griseus]SCE63199.1 hypothetical protein GA0115261_118073 [Streptomyces sp. OspMP-M43]